MTVLGPTDAGVRVSIGVSGSGKSHGIADNATASAFAGMPIIIIDSVEEWNSIPEGLAREPHSVTSVADAAKLIEEGDRIAIVSPRSDSPGELVALADAAAAWALADRTQLRGIVVPEAWLVLPSSGKLPPAISRLTRAWRHYNAAAWFDAQRISMVSRNVTELARELRLYAAVGDRDLAIIRDIGGLALVEAVGECTQRYADGEPGWHVTLGLRRAPPFEISR